MSEDLKIIKKLYGEGMAHLCRDLFSTILETEGLLPKLLQDNFAPYHYLFEDLIVNDLINEFKSFIYNIYDQKDIKVQNIAMTPRELMSLVGYKLYECNSEADIQSFRRYYAKGEELCTFNGGRLNRCHVFFAVKENVDEIKRLDFKTPERQDLYGTSVISIQFSKDNNYTLSIKNRYNHTVENPDATFGNDLEKIIPGLTSAFERTYGLVQTHKNGGFEIPGYVKANDGKFYKYNYEDNNIYYCPDNIIIDNFEVKHFAKERYIVFDFYIIDLKEKKIYLYNKELIDSFPEVISEIEKISVIKNADKKKIEIVHKDGELTTITIDKQNRIIELASEKVVDAKDYFLWLNKTIVKISLPNLKRVGQDFVGSSRVLREIYVPRLETAGSAFLYSNQFLESFEAPNLVQVGHNFLRHNEILKSLVLPKLTMVGDGFLFANSTLESIDLPMIVLVGDEFFYHNRRIKSLSLPSLEETGSCFFSSNTSISNVDCPNLKVIGSHFLFYNTSLQSLSLPEAETIGNDFIRENSILKEFNAPKLFKIGNGFMNNNRCLSSLNLPCLKEVLDDFLFYNNSLASIDCPALKSVGRNFLYYRLQPAKFFFPSLAQVNDCFLQNAASIELIAPNLRKIGLYIIREEIKAIAEENCSRETRK